MNNLQNSFKKNINDSFCKINFIKFLKRFCAIHIMKFFISIFNNFFEIIKIIKINNNEIA